MNKAEIQKAIDDLKAINAAYFDKENRSEMLCGILIQAEKGLLDDFYKAMNRPVVKKKAAKKQRPKQMSDNPSDVSHQ